MVKESTATLAEASAVAQSGSSMWLRRAGIALLGSLAVAVAAHVTVPLPWTPIPFTLQPMAVLLVGLLLGPSLGFATMVLYLAEGAMGLPVFQPHGPGGLLQLAGPTGGFLWSYPLVAMIAGALYPALRSRPPFIAAMYACFAAIVVLFTAGAAQLAVLTHASAQVVLASAVGPFLPGELIKIMAASGIVAAWSTRVRQ
ncbi:biotin transporter BioY [Terriglobus sp.]|uniref:biotin transporter BioY n=1 Tax=Terriglobus sp. TaxID=1889013 RepID=UPI003B00F861